MSSFSSKLVPILLVVPVNILGAKLLLTPRQIDTIDFLLLQRGWPWVFLESAESYQSGMPFRIDVFSFWMLAADLAVLLGIIVAGAWFVVWHCRRHGGRFQLSLRALLLLVAIIAAGCSWWFHEWSYSKRQEAFLAKFGAVFGCYEKATGPLWLRRLTGNDRIFECVVAVSSYWQKPPREWKETFSAAVAELPSMTRCSFDPEEPLAEDDLAFLSPFEELETSRSFDDRTVPLLSQLPKLRVLDLAHHGSLTDEQIRQLVDLPHLERVTLPAETLPETVAFLKRRIRTVEVAPAEWIITDDTISSEMDQRLRQLFHAAAE